MEIASENRTIDVLTPEDIDKYMKLPRWKRGFHKMIYAFGTTSVDPMDRTSLMMSRAFLDITSYPGPSGESRALASYKAFLDANPGYTGKCDCQSYICALGHYGKR